MKECAIVCVSADDFEVVIEHCGIPVINSVGCRTLPNRPSIGDAS